MLKNLKLINDILNSNLLKNFDHRIIKLSRIHNLSNI